MICEFIQCARLITRKWRIRSSPNSHASHTAHKLTPIHTNIFVRIDDVITCPLLVEPTRHRWFPPTRGNWCGGFDIRTVVRSNKLFNWHSSCRFETLSFSFPLLKFRSTLIFVQIRTVVYILSPTTKFHAYHGACLHCLCMQADGQTDGQGATDNEYTPTPIPRGKRYSHRYKCYLVLVLLKAQFLGKRTIRQPFRPTIMFDNLW